MKKLIQQNGTSFRYQIETGDEAIAAHLGRKIGYRSPVIDSIDDVTDAALNAAINGATEVPYPTPPQPTLADVKAEKIAEIDRHTSELIKAGFTHDGESFSMSENAQRNWTGLGTAHALGMIPFPYAVSTADEGQYVLADAAALMGFLAAYMTYQVDPTKPLGSGRALKAQVNACETIAEVEDIVDDRA